MTNGASNREYSIKANEETKNTKKYEKIMDLNCLHVKIEQVNDNLFSDNAILTVILDLNSICQLWPISNCLE
jgi:hypothetical protein